MRWADVASDWPAFIDAIRTRFPEAEREELAAVDGDRARLNAYLGQTYGLTPREADAQIEEWLKGPFPADAQMDETRDDANIANALRHVAPGEDVYADDADFGDDRVADTPIGRK